ncbi:carboxylesterase family domain-containing protein [Trichoderma breve]|uniref:Carboxylic ester hydrolase n=1 Tax=Trichoderma breve TaxID=2034170 RepID=A0A9W9BG35_9HYPO|nr:carboxylesterase family domain-containing protein [Trichoderma breve]KAJ4858911.1 carboxylesterase family domain-containing protein [Trichoderma breve]
MKKAIAWVTLALGLLPISVAAQGQVNVTIPSGTIIGNSIDNIEEFNGIPFADPPVGQLRLRPPQKLSTHLGDFYATGVAKLCPQGPIIRPDDNQSEDCLTVTIHRPSGTKAGDNLPVLFYIFGGGFMIGGTSVSINNPTKFVQASIELGKPFIFAAVNYRVAGWGFMPGSEILREGSANAGLLDQRMGLEWVADNIEAFGGDPSKVTIWGQSSGSISVFDQLILYDGDNTYNGNPLFRAAIMNSGSVTPVDPVDSAKSQALYEHVVREANCEGDDSLACLRGLSHEDFAAAANSVPGLLSYESLALSYLPRPDGKFPAVPMIFASQEDEGTLFSFFQEDMGSTDKITDYLSDLYFHNANKSLVRSFVSTYSERPEDGSPYRTGTIPPLCPYPGKKRIASILGDIVFTLIRRWTLETIDAVHPGLDLWSSFASYDYLLNPLGTKHGSDTTVFFNKTNTYPPTLRGRKYYINFVYNMDPNDGLPVNVTWPKYTEGKQLLWYNLLADTLRTDDFRSNTSDFITDHIDSLRF